MSNGQTKARNRKASFWSYTGNHPDGKDCPRNNLYGYPMILVSYLACQGGEGVTVKSGKSDGFGHVVEVSAPKEIWEQKWEELADCNFDIAFDAIEQDEDGLYWGRTKQCWGDPDEITELFTQSEDQSRLEMVKAGYVPVRQTTFNDELWVAMDEVAEV